jgi:hypothetical protein
VTTGGGRRRGRGGQRLLYFFRTPPGIRVGRAPIDEDAIRLLEAHNPDIQFDWTRILKGPQQPLTAPQSSVSRRSEESRESRRSGESREGGREGGRDDRRERRGEQRRPQPGPGSQLPASSSQLTASSSQLPASGSQLPASSGSEPVEPEPEPLEAESWLEADSGQPEAERAEPERAEPERAEPGEPEPLAAGPWQLAPGNWQLAADVEPRYARIGAEGLARLRARYAEVMARITEKPLEEAVKEELRGKAERLNPDAWVTEAEVTAALEQYETVFEALRPLVGSRPRRRRRRRV